MAVKRLNHVLEVRRGEVELGGCGKTSAPAAGAERTMAQVNGYHDMGVWGCASWQVGAVSLLGP
jgi:hypothetical protein